MKNRTRPTAAKLSLATAVLSLGIAAPASAKGPPPGTLAVQCDGDQPTLVVRGNPVAPQPGTCTDRPGKPKPGEITL